MKKGTLFFFSILLFLQLQQDLALGDLHRLENQAFQLASHKQQGKLSSDNVNMRGESHGEKLKTEDFGTEKKAQRGKGSYGGANVVHKGPKSKSAAPILKRAIGFISTTNVCISLSLLLILPHLIA